VVDVSGTRAPGLTGVLAEVLRSDRAELNARFAAARHASPSLDPEAFASVLVELVAPLVEVCEGALPGSARRVGSELYDIALELTAQGRILGPVRSAWSDLLPALAAHVSAEPRRVAGGVLNAVVTLEQAPGARPDEWADRMRAAAPRCADAETLLRAGQVAAWRAGMAGYRTTALDLAATLPPDVLPAVLGAGAEHLDGLRADPWFDPADAVARPPVRVGAFRGFGGTFVRPPVLEPALDPATGAVVAVDGTERWLVLADAFGWSITRPGPPVASDAGGGATVPPVILTASAGAGSPVPPEIVAQGHVLAEPTSWLAVPGALAVTSALSHAVHFLPGAGSEMTP
jgi:hypothetical protein